MALLDSQLLLQRHHDGFAHRRVAAADTFTFLPVIIGRRVSCRAYPGEGRDPMGGHLSVWYGLHRSVRRRHGIQPERGLAAAVGSDSAERLGLLALLSRLSRINYMA